MKVHGPFSEGNLLPETSSVKPCRSGSGFGSKLVKGLHDGLPQHGMPPRYWATIEYGTQERPSLAPEWLGVEVEDHWTAGTSGVGSRPAPSRAFPRRLRQ